MEESIFGARHPNFESKEQINMETRTCLTRFKDAVLTEPAKPPQVFYRTVKIDGLDIFYREAGPKDAPAVLLLHGFPTSSHMFRNLIPFLAGKFHVVAPDYPGYGSSSAPS